MQGGIQIRADGVGAVYGYSARKFNIVRSCCLGVVSLAFVCILMGLHTRFPAMGVTCARSQLSSNANSRILETNDTHSTPDWHYNWDRKAFEIVNERKTIATRTIVLVRHGQYHANSGSLTPLGQNQAALTGLRLREMNVSFDAIIHSPLPRAVETAKLIGALLPNTPLSSDVMLAEGGPIPPKPTITYWRLPNRTYFVDGPRIESAFRKYFYRADNNQEHNSWQILVGHGNIFRFFALRALQLPRHAWMRVFIAHGSITAIHINGDGTVNMSKFGDAGHMAIKEITY